MKSTLEYVHGGFRLAGRRAHVVVLDMGAKLIWLVISAVLFGAAGLWFASEVTLTEQELLAWESGNPTLAGLALLSAIGKDLPALIRAVAGAVLICFLGWVVLEAFFRGGLLPNTRQNFFFGAFRNFGVYFWSGLLTRSALAMGVLSTLAITAGPLLTAPLGEWSLLWPNARWPLVGGSGIVLLLAFGLVTLETLVRSDALGSSGLELFQFLGVLLTLALVEVALVLGTTAAGLALVQMTASGGRQLGVVFLLVGFLSVSHSYMILARYSAVDIMRRETEYGAPSNDANDL